MGKAEIPAAPISGLILPPVSMHIILPKRTPTAVSRQMATKPRHKTNRVCRLKKLLASIVAPMHKPSSKVTMLVISFSEALFKRSTQPLSLIKLPSMTVPINGAPLGARIEAKMVTTTGKIILVVFEIGCFLAAPMTICLSLFVVSARMIGGWISGTKDIYE